MLELLDNVLKSESPETKDIVSLTELQLVLVGGGGGAASLD